MHKQVLLVLLLLLMVMLFPPLAQAVPVEPSSEWVHRDQDTGVLKVTQSITAQYKTEFTAVNTRPEYNTVSRAANRPDVRKLLATANSLLGQPYVYGSTGPSSFDCSGFTLYVFKKVGINLPHSASAQAKYGSKIDKQDLRPGDLVFFGYHGSRNIEHVGIYVGNGEFIHASSDEGITITPLASNYYARNYRGAGRILPS